MFWILFGAYVIVVFAAMYISVREHKKQKRYERYLETLIRLAEEKRDKDG